MITNGNVLYIFDFDDTLAMTNSAVRVISASGQVKRLDSREFAKYRYQAGDQLDFSEFTRAEGTLIDNTVQEMQEAISRYGIENVFIVTARAEDEPVFNFLDSFGLVVPQVIATEGSAGKAPWLTKTLLLGNYDKVIVYEDCRKNIKMLRDVVEAYNEELNREVLYSAVCILPDGRQQMIESRIRRFVRKIILTEGVRNTTQGANAIINVMLDNPDYSIRNAAADVFWNFEQLGNRRAARFHRASMDRVGEQIQKRLAKTGADPHNQPEGFVYTPEEKALVDLYHSRVPTNQHGEYGIKLADWRKFR